MEMEFKVGDVCRPLPNSPQYGPKYWKLTVEGGVRTWIEIEMSKEDRDFERLESTLAWASPSFPWARSTPITEADAEKEPGLKSYVDGFAMFPKTARHIPGNSPEARAERAAQADAWEKRSLAMHDAQEPLPALADKPEDSVGTGNYFQELRRGD